MGCIYGSDGGNEKCMRYFCGPISWKRSAWKNEIRWEDIKIDFKKTDYKD
jgi:hypothetical protein